MGETPTSPIFLLKINSFVRYKGDKGKSVKKGVALNWEIVPQERTVKGETILVDCKEIKYRPASERELEEGSGTLKRLGIPTYKILFKHIKDDGIFRVVMQHRKGRWQLNLHDPDKVKPVEMRQPNRVTCVTLPHPERKQVVKSSTGTYPYEVFFGRIFGERIKDESFRLIIQSLFDEAIRQREEKMKQAA